jgi:hypothetical protein
MIDPRRVSAFDRPGRSSDFLRTKILTLFSGLLLLGSGSLLGAESRRTTVSIRGDQFFITGRPTFAGCECQGHKDVGLLVNARRVELIRSIRRTEAYAPKPIINHEGDQAWRDVHQGWGRTGHNFVACVANGVSWGCFDYRERGEGFDEGFQSVPVNWRLSSDRKRGFLGLLAETTGSPAARFKAANTKQP